MKLQTRARPQALKESIDRRQLGQPIMAGQKEKPAGVQRSAGPGCTNSPMFNLSSLPRIKKKKKKNPRESNARAEARPGTAKCQPASILQASGNCCSEIPVEGREGTEPPKSSHRGEPPCQGPEQSAFKTQPQKEDQYETLTNPAGISRTTNNY